jgi:hypothetical protein
MGSEDPHRRDLCQSMLPRGNDVLHQPRVTGPRPVQHCSQQLLNSPVTMSVFDQGISGAMMTSIAVSPSMAKMTATASVESD